MGCLWAIEGVDTYGARLAKAVTDAGYDVAEAPRMNARNRRGSVNPTRWTQPPSELLSSGWRMLSSGLRGGAKEPVQDSGSSVLPGTN